MVRRLIGVADAKVFTKPLYEAAGQAQPARLTWLQGQPQDEQDKSGGSRTHCLTHPDGAGWGPIGIKGQRVLREERDDR